jgi:uncharacterized membrane protein YhfC
MNPLLIGGYAAAAGIDIIAPLLLALWISKRFGGAGRAWRMGAAVFAVFQLCTRMPVVMFIQSRPELQQAVQGSSSATLLFVLALSLSAALFEEGGRWIGYRFWMRERDAGSALMYGAGHGGLESIAIGLMVVGTLVGYVTLSAMPAQAVAALGPEQIRQVQEARAQFAGLTGWEPLLGAWERLASLAVQLALSLMVLQAFIRSRRWWWYALGAHTAVNLVSVLAARLAVQRWGEQGGGLVAEGVITVFGLAALWGVARLARSGPPAAARG